MARKGAFHHYNREQTNNVQKIPTWRVCGSARKQRCTTRKPAGPGHHPRSRVGDKRRRIRDAPTTTLGRRPGEPTWFENYTKKKHMTEKEYLSDWGTTSQEMKREITPWWHRWQQRYLREIFKTYLTKPCTRMLSSKSWPWSPSWTRIPCIYGKQGRNLISQSFWKLCRRIDNHTNSGYSEIIRREDLSDGVTVLPAIWSMKRKRRIASREV